MTDCDILACNDTMVMMVGSHRCVCYKDHPKVLPNALAQRPFLIGDN